MPTFQLITEMYGNKNYTSWLLHFFLYQVRVISIKSVTDIIYFNHKKINYFLIIKIYK